MRPSDTLIFFVIKNVLGLKKKFLRDRLFKKTRNLVTYQQEILFRKIKKNQDSDFGKRFGFSRLKTVLDFQRAVPLSEYDLFQPYIEKLKQGDVGALFGKKEKLLMFALTSGTTGRSKYIPVTQSFFEEYREGAFFWASHLAEEFKDLVMGRILPIFSPLEEEKSPSGLPCGAISGLIAKMQGRLIQSLYAAPFEVSLFSSSRERQYAFLRAAAEFNVTLIITANPSTLINFAKVLEENAEILIHDLAQGTLNGQKPSFPLKKMEDRSLEFAKILRENGKLTPKDIWPQLQALACWKGGTLFHYLKELPEHYGNTLIKDLGLLASEGRFSFPIFPDSDEGLLNVFHHFLEFIPETEEDNDQPRTVLAHELEAGKRYFLVITTSSGLYRYKLHDLIEVRGFYRGIPRIVFLNKGRHIASLTGEKLTEHQVLTAVQNATQRFHVSLSHFRMFPSFEPLPHYLLLAEKGECRVSDPETFLKVLDEEFQRLNVEYATKRTSLRLENPCMAWVRKGTFSDKQKKSHRPEQFKPVYLDPDPENWRKYENAIEK